MKNKVNEESNLLTKLKAREPLLHIGFWIIYLLFPFFKSVSRDTSYHFYSELNDLFFGMIVFYISYALFLPSKNKLRNVIVVFIIYCTLGFFNLKIHNFLFKGTHEESFLGYYAIGYISNYTILSLFAYILYSIKELYKKQSALDLANSQKKQAELSGLKSQINPHFLFNTLNTIYASALTKDDKTAEMILKLSDNLRYVLHGAQTDYVSLKMEVKHIKDYINLQEERLSDKVKVAYSEEIDNYDQAIAPLLLISFVENSFKFTSLLRGSKHQIKIKIKLSGKEFTFYCENSFKKNVIENSNTYCKIGGIGISNTKERLEYLYPENYKLQIIENNGLFKVNLKIQL